MVMDYNIFGGSLQEVSFKDAKVVNTINPHSYCIARKDPEFDQALKSSDLLLPDGVGIVWATRFLKGRNIRKIAGYDVFHYLLQQLNADGGSCFFLGSSEHVLGLIESRLSEEFPNIQVGTFSPPYKPQFDEQDNRKMLEAVNGFQPDVLFVGMTAPKQEKWVYTNKGNLKVRNICSIGAVFDFYAGTVKRSSAFWIKLGLEWLPRFLKEPKRLAERNLISSPKFVLEVLSFKVRNRGFL